MNDTNAEYNVVINSCKNIFIKKAKDYGTSWRVLRPISIADQIYIKAKRIRTIQENNKQMVADGIADEFRGIINYCVIGLIQLQLGGEVIEDIPLEKLSALYDEKVSATKALMQNKNTDYGEAWREMEQESFVDLILQKIHRMKQIIRNDGVTIISEGLDANYMDILNYAVFALIMM
jgi:hypothetical protein